MILAARRRLTRRPNPREDESSETMTRAEPNAQGASGSETNGVGHYADVNGIRLYYEIHGTGRPLILLHGGLGAIEMFGPNLPALARGGQVIGVDLQGHGRTADVDRPLSADLMADDIAALIKHLKLERSDIMAYSLVGGVALLTAIRHPELVDKLVVVSTPIKPAPSEAVTITIAGNEAHRTTSDADGAINTSFFFPELSVGTHALVAADATGHQARARLHVTVRP